MGGWLGDCCYIATQMAAPKSRSSSSGAFHRATAALHQRTAEARRVESERSMAAVKSNPASEERDAVDTTDVDAADAGREQG